MVVRSISSGADLDLDTRHQQSAWSIYDHPELYDRVFSDRDISAEVCHNQSFVTFPPCGQFAMSNYTVLYCSE